MMVAVAGCLLGVLAIAVYLFFVFAAYWLIDYFFDFPTWVSIACALFIVSVLSTVTRLRD